MAENARNKLQAQLASKRGRPETVVVRERGLRDGGPTMSVPGDGKVSDAVGTMAGRSAAHFAKPTSRKFGGA